MSNESLAGKTVLITGGARRVGAAIARELHAAGADIAIHYRRSASDAEALAVELNTSRPRSAATVQADLLDLAKLPDLVKFAVRSFGGLDVLVNNASTFHPTAPAQTHHEGVRERRARTAHTDAGRSQCRPRCGNGGRTEPGLCGSSRGRRTRH